MKPTIIAHVCNDKGGWGKGFVLAISKRWKEPERQYRNWAQTGVPVPFELGNVQIVEVENDVWVANILGQHGTISRSNPKPVRYDAIRLGLREVAIWAKKYQASIQMPRIGCGFAGGSWDVIEPIIEEELIQKGITVTVFDFP